MTKGVHFTFCGETFTQTDGVAMGSQLGRVLGGILMVQLKTHLIPTLKGHLLCRKCYVDDIICFLETGSTTHILNILKNFHPSIKVTYESESDTKISFFECTANIEQKTYRDQPTDQPTTTFTFIATLLHQFNGNVAP